MLFPPSNFGCCSFLIETKTQRGCKATSAQDSKGTTHHVTSNKTSVTADSKIMSHLNHWANVRLAFNTRHVPAAASAVDFSFMKLRVSSLSHCSQKIFRMTRSIFFRHKGQVPLSSFTICGAHRRQTHRCKLVNTQLSR